MTTTDQVSASVRSSRRYVKQSCWIVSTIEPDADVIAVYLSKRQAEKHLNEGFIYPGGKYPADLTITEAPLMHAFETRGAA